MDLPTVEHALMFSRNYAAASPYLGKTAREHITGLCDLLEATQAMLMRKAELGDWRLKHDLHLRMGITSFWLSAGAIVAVTQLDREYGKVMVEAGPAMCDWMAEGWLLEHFENVT